jgi:hypothetical protein
MDFTEGELDIESDKKESYRDRCQWHMYSLIILYVEEIIIH